MLHCIGQIVDINTLIRNNILHRPYNRRFCRQLHYSTYTCSVFYNRYIWIFLLIEIYIFNQSTCSIDWIDTITIFQIFLSNT